MAPHEHLGLPPEASFDDIHERFRGLAGMLHPSVGGDASEFLRLQESYEAFVTERCAALGVPEHQAAAEMALVKQDPWALSERAAEGSSSLGSELLTGVQEVAGVARDRAMHGLAGTFVHGAVGTAFSGYGPDELPMADRDAPPLSFGSYVIAAVLALGIALAGLHFKNPNLDGRLFALHGCFYLLAIVLGPTLVAVVGALRDARTMWIGSALGIGVFFAALPPMPFLVHLHQQQLAEEALELLPPS